MPADDRLAGKRTVRLEQLADEAWSQADCAGLCGKMHVAACEAAGFEPQVTFQSDDYNVVQGLVAAGVAISLIPELALSNVREDVVIRSLPHRETPVPRGVAATLAGTASTPATTAMLRVLKTPTDT